MRRNVWRQWSGVRGDGAFTGRNVGQNGTSPNIYWNSDRIHPPIWFPSPTIILIITITNQNHTTPVEQSAECWVMHTDDSGGSRSRSYYLDNTCDYLLCNIYHDLDLHPNTPSQVDITPISKICFECFGHAKAFMSTSAVCSGSRQLSIINRFVWQVLLFNAIW